MKTTKTLLLSFISLTALVALPACDADGGGGGDSPDTPRGELPAELVGSWFNGSLSSIQYYDRVSGRWQDPSGSGFYFIFDADGGYETGAVIDSTVSGCTMRLLGNETGTVTRDADRLTVYRHQIKVHVTNSCGDSGERTQGRATRTLTWWIEIDELGLDWLVLVHDDGAVERYRRWTQD
ncbi:MAG: hypothetical protein IT385_15510 [Deltaproteobacteria bacterium]|nr:hypothetical protein [Deltaproteobacteria bacterium]